MQTAADPQGTAQINLRPTAIVYSTATENEENPSLTHF